MSYDFSGLTPAQQRVLTFQGWSMGQGKQPSKATVRKLVDRGLLVARERKFMATTVTEYDVPIPVHAAWCAWCSQQEQSRAS